jgi:hypothetical protein
VLVVRPAISLNVKMRRFAFVAFFALTLPSCSASDPAIDGPGSQTGSSSGSGGDGTNGGTSSGGDDANAATDARANDGAQDGGADAHPEAGSDAAPLGDASSCIGSDLLAQLGKTRLMVGASMADATAKVAGFDIRYLYLAGQLPDQAGACSSCQSSCTTTSAGATVTCADYNPGCGWWGCWQDVSVAPGQYVSGFIAAAKLNAQIPMLTYYV